MNNPKVLIACEESQTVCTAFRSVGIEAYSADIQECSGKHPEWHVHGDVLPILNGHCKFQTMDEQWHELGGAWDLIIAHPPCTYLTSAGTRHFSLRCNPEWKVKERELKREEAFDFFLKFTETNCKRVVIENPVGYVNTHWKKPTQIIHPYFFANSKKDVENYVQKRTCLWIKGLPELQRINNLEKPEPKYICQGEKCKGKAIGWCEGIKGTHGGQAGKQKQEAKHFQGLLKLWQSNGAKFY